MDPCSANRFNNVCVNNQKGHAFLLRDLNEMKKFCKKQSNYLTTTFVSNQEHHAMHDKMTSDSGWTANILMNL